MYCKDLSLDYFFFYTGWLFLSCKTLFKEWGLFSDFTTVGGMSYYMFSCHSCLLLLLILPD